MTDKFMYIPNDNTQIALSVEYYKWFKRLDTQVNEQTNQNSLKVPSKLKDKKRYYKSLGTHVMKSPMSPLSLLYCTLRQNGTNLQ